MVGSDTPGISLPSLLSNFAGTFGSFALGEGNKFGFTKPLFFKDRLKKNVKDRRMGYFERQYQILNAQELATLWHPPGKSMAGIKSKS